MNSTPDPVIFKLIQKNLVINRVEGFRQIKKDANDVIVNTPVTCDGVDKI